MALKKHTFFFTKLHVVWGQMHEWFNSYLAHLYKRLIKQKKFDIPFYKKIKSIYFWHLLKTDHLIFLALTDIRLVFYKRKKTVFLECKITDYGKETILHLNFKEVDLSALPGQIHTKTL